MQPSNDTAPDDEILSRLIPAETKRAVRQACGFGCVICGLPVWDYEHINDFALGGGHDVENLALLCPTHHAEKTRGRMHRDVVAKHRQNPYNLRHHVSAAHRLHQIGDSCTVEMGGGGTYILNFDGDGYATAIEIFGRPVLGLYREDGNLLIDALFTGKTGVPLLQIERGELTVSTGVWDFESRGDTFVIRSGPGDQELVLKTLPDGLRVERGNIEVNGVRVTITADGMTTPMGSFGGGFMMLNCKKGLVIR